jgi:hypothetical protein
MRRALPEEQNAEVERLEGFALNTNPLCINIPLFHCFGVIISA